jgi:hypothetical protein
MGISGSRIKIPDEEPGKLIKSTGIPEFDKMFKKCEDTLNIIVYSKDKLDIATTKYIKSLGAHKHWEIAPGFRSLIKMMMTNLCVLANGDLSNLELTYIERSPFIELN